MRSSCGADVGVGGDRLGALAVVVGLCIGGADAVGPEQQLRRELLVLVVDAGREAQLAQNGPAEQVAAGRGLEVVVRQVLGAAVQVVGVVCGSGVAVGRRGEVEHHHVGVAVSHQFKAVLVGQAQQVVVAVDKLQVAACGGLYAPVAGLAESLMVLPYVDNLAEILVESGQRTVGGTVVDDNDFALVAGQRECQYAVYALA